MTLYAVWEKIENNFDVNLPGSTSFSIYQSTDGDNVTFECRSNWWFDSYTWYIDGVKQTSTSEEMTVDTSAMKAGIYTIMLKVKNNGTYWSETTTLIVNK
jgi:PKD repeat protein